MTGQETIIGVLVMIIGAIIGLVGLFSGHFVWTVVGVLAGLYIIANGYAFINLKGLDENYLLIYQWIHKMYFQQASYNPVGGYSMFS